jgi:rhamnogalacturonyl hydrolase YesR
MPHYLLLLLALGVAQDRRAADVGQQLGPAVTSVAALRGEPSIVSAAGITRDETPLLTIENPGAFDLDRSMRRVVIVGGLDGDRASADAVLAAVRWFKTMAPASVRRRWSLSALPLADPAHRAAAAAFVFPPLNGFFDDAQQPESRYVWRWITYQAPDLVIEVRGPHADAGTLAAAFADPNAAGLGAVPVEPVAAADAVNAVKRVLEETRGRSALHDGITTRVAREPLAMARVLARLYPQAPILSYIPSVAWTSELRLTTITGEPEWRDKVREQTRAWIAGEKAPLGDQKLLPSIAGYMIFGELAAIDGNAAARALLLEGAELAATRQADGIYANGRGWTDDMFMATAVLARAGRHDVAAHQLIDYAARLQRPDGVFIHAVDGPVAWGRGNGFAAFGLMEALTAMPPGHAARPRLLEMFQRQASAMKVHQAPDGSWREIIDRPGAYREETATAMLMTAIARGVRLGWLDGSYMPVVQRAWRALSAHVAADGALIDVCSGTGAGPTARYYYDRPAIDGPDDRGGAMALAASLEMYELTHTRR